MLKIKANNYYVGDIGNHLTSIISGEEDLEGTRQHSYLLANVFLVCFSVVSPASFKNVKEKVCIQ